MKPPLKRKHRKKGIVDTETPKLEARLFQLIEIICLPIEPSDRSVYYGKAKTIATELGLSTEDLERALKQQREYESVSKGIDGGRYQHLVDQVFKQLDKLCLGESHQFTLLVTPVYYGRV